MKNRKKLKLFQKNQEIKSFNQKEKKKSPKSVVKLKNNRKHIVGKPEMKELTLGGG